MSLKARIRPALFWVATWSWTLLFALAGRLLRLQARCLQVTGRDRVLVIAPHPDDETLGCGGTMLRHVRGGERICVLIVTDGAGSQAGGLSKAEMARERGEETIRALHHVAPGAEVVQLGFPEGHWSAGDLRGKLSQQLTLFAPTVIYAPSCVDYHPEHIRVAQAVADVLEQSAESIVQKIRIYEVQVPLTPVLVNIVSDIEEHFGEKIEALRSYRTQAQSLGTQADTIGWPLRYARYLRALFRKRGYIEAFWEVTPEQYVKIARRGLNRHTRYRSMRPRPFTDGFAWTAGFRARRHLKRNL